jgi:hypothetical protein
VRRVSRRRLAARGLRQDRILEEGGTRDPMFGLHPNTAQRYVDAVYGRHVLGRESPRCARFRMTWPRCEPAGDRRVVLGLPA